MAFTRTCIIYIETKLGFGFFEGKFQAKQKCDQLALKCMAN